MAVFTFVNMAVVDMDSAVDGNRAGSAAELASMMQRSPHLDRKVAFDGEPRLSTWS